MTVKELIKHLERIKDKSKPVFFEDYEYGLLEVQKIEEDDRFYGDPVVLGD